MGDSSDLRCPALPTAGRSHHFVRTRRICSDHFLTRSVIGTIAGAGMLLSRRFRRGRAKRAEGEAATRSRFRSTLANELRSRPLEELDFVGLVAASQISRDAADLIADEFFRKAVVRCAGRWGDHGKGTP